MPFGDFVNQIPAPVFLPIHLVGFLIGAFFAWRSFSVGATLLGTAFTLFALAEISYMTYHLDWTVFLFATRSARSSISSRSCSCSSRQSSACPSGRAARRPPVDEPVRSGGCREVGPRGTRPHRRRRRRRLYGRRGRRRRRQPGRDDQRRPAEVLQVRAGCDHGRRRARP